MGGRFSSLLLDGELQDLESDFALSEQIAFADLTSNKMEDVSIDLILQIKRRLKDIQEEIV